MKNFWGVSDEIDTIFPDENIPLYGIYIKYVAFILLSWKECLFLLSMNFLG